MNRVTKPIVLASIAGALIFGSTNAMAQQRQGRGDFDPEQMRQRMMEMYQERLGFSGEEWKAVWPFVQKILDAQRGVATGRGGFGFFGGGRGGPGGGGGGGGRGGLFGGTPTPEAEAQQKATEALRQAAESGTPEEKKAKLQAWKETVKKNKAALEEAQAALLKHLTTDQEIQAYLIGLLEVK